MNWHFVFQWTVVRLLYAFGWMLLVAPIDSLTLHAQVTEPRLADGRIDYLAKLNRSLREGVTPETNAAVILLEVLGERVVADIDRAAFLRELGLDRFPKNRPQFLSEEEYARQLGFVPGTPQHEQWTEAIEQSLAGPWTAEQLPEVARWIEINEPAIAEVIKASQLPRYYCPLFPSVQTEAKSKIPVVEVSLELGQATRELTRHLYVRVRKELGSGNMAAAINDIQAIRRLASLQAQSSTIVEALVAIALRQQAFFSEVELLGSGRLTAEQCNVYRGFLRDEKFNLHLADRIETAERWMFLDAVQMVPSGKVLDYEIPYDASDLDLPILESRATNYATIANVWRKSHDRERIANIKKIEVELTDDVQRRLTPDVYEQSIFRRSLRSRIVGDALFALMMPNCTAMATAEIRTTVTQDLSELAFAIESYRLDNGRLPEVLNVLQPDYLADIPKDRFSNEPFVYRPDANGYVLYSVGENMRDDNGETINDHNDADDWPIKLQLKSK